MTTKSPHVTAAATARGRCPQWLTGECHGGMCACMVRLEAESTLAQHGHQAPPPRRSTEGSR